MAERVVDPGVSSSLKRLYSSVCPLAFATGYAEAPFSILGTGFLVQHDGGFYFLTADHSVGRADHKSILVYPAGREPRARTRHCWRIVQDHDDKDSTDLFILEIDPESIGQEIRHIGRAIDLTPRNNALWLAERWASTFFLIGYPAVANCADYDFLRLMLAPVLLRGSYARSRADGRIHELHVQNPLCIPDLNGFSGSPVFSTASSIGISQPARFCGMVLRGTVVSETVHFIATDSILLALNQIKNESWSVG